MADAVAQLTRDWQMRRGPAADVMRLLEYSEHHAAADYLEEKTTGHAATDALSR